MEPAKELAVGDGRLIFTRIASLHEIAGLSVAFELYRRGYRDIKEWDYSDYIPLFEWEKLILRRANRNDQALYVYVMKSLLPQLHLSALIRDALEQYVQDVIMEVREWADYLQSDVFNEIQNTGAVVFSFLAEIVWKSNGKIDYRETAIKILANPKIKKSEKLKLITAFCLEDDMKEDLQTSGHATLKTRTLSRNPLVPLVDELRMGNNPNPTRNKVNNLPAVLYYWRHLDEDAQVQLGQWLIRIYSLKFQNELLSEMNQLQQHKMFTQLGGVIICNFVKKPSYLEFALSTWNFIRDSITENQYSTLISEMLSMYMDGYIMSLTKFFSKMWETTPDHLKCKCLTIENEEVRGLLVDFTNTRGSLTQISFLNEILPKFEANVRQKVFIMVIKPINYFGRITTVLEKLMYAKYTLLADKFMKVCWSNDEEEANILKTLLSFKIIKMHCIGLIKRAKWESYEEFAAFYVAGRKDLAEFKMEVLIEVLSNKREDRNTSALCFGDMPIELEWQAEDFKRFGSGIDVEKLLPLLTNFTEGSDLETRLLLLLKILPLIDEKQRRRTLGEMISRQLPDRLSSWDLEGVPPSLLQDFVKLLLSVHEEKETKCVFLEWYFIYLFSNADWERFDEFIRLYLPRLNDRLGYRKELFESKRGMEAYIKKHLVWEHYRFIERTVKEIFPTVEEGTYYLEHLLKSNTAIELCYHEWFRRGQISRVIKCITFFLNSDENLKAVKTAILGFYRSPSKFIEMYSPLKDSEWNEFVNFLFGDDKEMLMVLKRSLSSRSIFWNILAMSNYYDISEFIRLSRFLNWYFESTERSNEFKVRMVYTLPEDWRFSEMLASFRRHGHSSKDARLQRFVRWLFNDDPKEIDKFRRYCHLSKNARFQKFLRWLLNDDQEEIDK